MSLNLDELHLLVERNGSSLHTYQRTTRSNQMLIVIICFYWCYAQCTFIRVTASKRTQGDMLLAAPIKHQANQLALSRR